jgi:hypothetical protein
MPEAGNEATGEIETAEFSNAMQKCHTTTDALPNRGGLVRFLAVFCAKSLQHSHKIYPQLCINGR